MVKESGRCRVRCVGFMNDNRDPENRDATSARGVMFDLRTDFRC